MEEPPEHVKFILCTTEAQGAPTIQSRCQRFDFKNIDSRASPAPPRVLKQEKVEAEPSVIAQVARLANGSMRDSLTLMDRLLATGEKKLTSSSCRTSSAPRATSSTGCSTRAGFGQGALEAGTPSSRAA